MQHANGPVSEKLFPPPIKMGKRLHLSIYIHSAIMSHSIILMISAVFSSPVPDGIRQCIRQKDENARQRSQVAGRKKSENNCGKSVFHLHGMAIFI